MQFLKKFDLLTGDPIGKKAGLVIRGNRVGEGYYRDEASAVIEVRIESLKLEDNRLRVVCAPRNGFGEIIAEAEGVVELPKRLEWGGKLIRDALRELRREFNSRFRDPLFQNRKKEFLTLFQSEISETQRKKFQENIVSESIDADPQKYRCRYELDKAIKIMEAVLFPQDLD